MARRPCDAAARMASRAAQIQALDRTSIIRMAQHRTRRENLPQIECSVEYIATYEAESSLEIERRQYLARQHRAPEIRGVFVDCRNHEIGDGFAMVVPSRTVGQLRCDMLAE